MIESELPSQDLDPATTLMKLLEQGGATAYFGERVSVLEHSLQTAHLAELASAAPGTIVAALLHDIGHMLHGLDQDVAGHGQDGRHEQIAAESLSRWFGEEVTAPVRLHVDAKRFLCWKDPDYLRQLSASSRGSLALQGGPMSDGEAAAFGQGPFAETAVQLRQWDDEAKIPGLVVPGVAHYLPMLRATVVDKDPHDERSRLHLR